MRWIPSFMTVIVVAGLSATEGKAATITYEFSVEATSGPLVGTTSGGTFTFDSDIAPPGGGDVFGATLLNLDFTWNGVTYDESTVRGGNIIFDASGSLQLAFFGSDCDAFGCGLSSAVKSWLVYLYPFEIGQFKYTVGDTPLIYEDNLALLEGPIRPVPEPTTLLLLGLVGCGVMLRRKPR